MNSCTNLYHTLKDKSDKYFWISKSSTDEASKYKVAQESNILLLV